MNKLSNQQANKPSMKKRRRSSDNYLVCDIENEPRNDKKPRLDDSDDIAIDQHVNVSRIPLSEIPVDAPSLRIYRSSSQESLAEYDHDYDSSCVDHASNVGSSPNDVNKYASNCVSELNSEQVVSELCVAEEDDEIMGVHDSSIEINSDNSDDEDNCDYYNMENQSENEETRCKGSGCCGRDTFSEEHHLSDTEDQMINFEQSSSIAHYNGSAMIASPAAMSDNHTNSMMELVDEFEDDYSPENIHTSEHNENKSQTKTISYMGQLTPSTPSVKPIPRMPHCPTWSSFRKMSVSTTLYSKTPTCPVPELTWTNHKRFWEIMCKKDEASIKVRNPDLFEYQAYLRPRMRAILLDWISEVAEVYDLHRETYYLTVDYIDRYMSVVSNVHKQQLQLIGVTCLFIAAKIEEIYPPKIDVFATITDGACTKEEIFAMEISILQHLDWHLSPVTVNYWLEMMLQFMYKAAGKTKTSSILLPTFSGMLFNSLCQLLDLAFLDVQSLRFSYGVLATAAIYILVDPELALSVSGLKKQDLQVCVEWMSMYWCVIQSQNPHETIDMADLPVGLTANFFNEHSPTRQKHTTSMDLYDLVQSQIDAPVQESQHNMLTPPHSNSKLMKNTSSSLQYQY